MAFRLRRSGRSSPATPPTLGGKGADGGTAGCSDDDVGHGKAPSVCVLVGRMNERQGPL